MFDREDHKVEYPDGEDGEGLVSEETETGDLDMMPLEAGMRLQSSNQGPVASQSSIRLVVMKKPGQLLGLRLFKSSLEVQSIEPESPLSIYLRDVPMGSIIASINNVAPNLDSVRQLLRDCKDLPSVCLVFVRPPCLLPLTSRQKSQSQPYMKCASYSSNSSSRGYSPTPSKLSTMWRRVSESGSCCAFPQVTTTPPQAMPEGVTAIDFTQLSRDFPKLWTRGRGSLPTPRARYDAIGDVPVTEQRIGLAERASTSLC